MYKTIILDCQDKDVIFNCDDCIVFKECSLAKKNTEELVDSVKTDNVEIFVSHV